MVECSRRPQPVEGARIKVYMESPIRLEENVWIEEALVERYAPPSYYITVTRQGNHRYSPNVGARGPLEWNRLYRWLREVP